MVYSNGEESCDMQKRLLNAYYGNGRGQGEVGQRAVDSATRQERDRSKMLCLKWLNMRGKIWLKGGKCIFHHHR